MKKQSVKRGLVIFGVGFGVYVVTSVIILFSYPPWPGMTKLEFREVWKGIWVGYKAAVGVGYLAFLIGFAMTIAGLITSDVGER